MQRHPMSYIAPAVPLLASGVVCLAIGLASHVSTFVWMAPGFLLAGGVLMWLGLRRRAR